MPEIQFSLERQIIAGFFLVQGKINLDVLQPHLITCLLLVYMSVQDLLQCHPDSSPFRFL